MAAGRIDVATKFRGCCVMLRLQRPWGFHVALRRQRVGLEEAANGQPIFQWQFQRLNVFDIFWKFFEFGSLSLIILSIF